MHSISSEVHPAPPAGEGRSVPVLYAGNARVFDGMVISLLSMLRHHRGPLNVFLFTMDLRDVSPDFAPVTEAQRRYLEELCRGTNPASRVILTDVGPLYRQTLLHAPNQDTQYTPYTFLRLFADRFPILPDRLIYLDTDTVLCGDIARLYEQELGDAEFAGVRDRYGCRFFGVNYLNAGVLLLNLAKIRQTGLFRRALEACARKKIFLSDQTALNRCAARKKVLPRRFNEQKAVRGDTVIRHFSMTIVWFPRFHTQNVKPWQVERVHDILHVTEFDDILNDYLSRRPHFPAV